MGPLAEYALMYRQLGRTDVFRSDYCKTKAAAAHKRWFASASSSSPSPIAARGGGVATGGGTGDGLARWLPSFLEYLQVRGWVITPCMGGAVFGYATYGFRCIWRGHGKRVGNVAALDCRVLAGSCSGYYVAYGLRRLWAAARMVYAGMGFLRMDYCASA